MAISEWETTLLGHPCHMYICLWCASLGYRFAAALLTLDVFFHGGITYGRWFRIPPPILHLQNGGLLAGLYDFIYRETASTTTTAAAAAAATTTTSSSSSTTSSSTTSSSSNSNSNSNNNNNNNNCICDLTGNLHVVFRYLSCLLGKVGLSGDLPHPASRKFVHFQGFLDASGEHPEMLRLTWSSEGCGPRWVDTGRFYYPKNCWKTSHFEPDKRPQKGKSPRPKPSIFGFPAVSFQWCNTRLQTNHFIKEPYEATSRIDCHKFFEHWISIVTTGTYEQDSKIH